MTIVTVSVKLVLISTCTPAARARRGESVAVLCTVQLVCWVGNVFYLLKVGGFIILFLIHTLSEYYTTLLHPPPSAWSAADVRTTSLVMWRMS